MDVNDLYNKIVDIGFERKLMGEEYVPLYHSSRYNQLPDYLCEAIDYFNNTGLYLYIKKDFNSGYFDISLTCMSEHAKDLHLYVNDIDETILQKIRNINIDILFNSEQ